MVGKKKRIFAGAFAVILVIMAFGTYKAVDYYKTLKEYRTKVANITINQVNLNRIPDGMYSGSSEAIWVAAEVKVTVKDHRIDRIALVSHKNERGLTAEVIPGKVVEAQSLKIDTVTGATVSSKIILKAIENALNSAVR